MATVEGSFTAADQTSDSFYPDSSLRRGRFNVSLSGVFEADVQVQRSFDGGETWIPVAGLDATPMTIDEPLSLACEETEASVAWRLQCTSYTSGTAVYRMSR